MDSLQKRLNFLDAVVKELGLSNVRLCHARAEDGGRDPSGGNSLIWQWLAA